MFACKGNAHGMYSEHGVVGQVSSCNHPSTFLISSTCFLFQALFLLWRVINIDLL